MLTNEGRHEMIKSGYCNVRSNQSESRSKTSGSEFMKNQG